MDDPLGRAREFFDRRTAIAMLSTVDLAGNPEVCILIAPRVIGEDRVAGGEERDVSGNTFRNLRQNARATIVVLDPIMDPRARDGVRVQAEFLGAEEDGAELKHLSGWLEGFAPGRKVVRRLIFKILSAEPFRPRSAGPVLLQ